MGNPQSEEIFNVYAYLTEKNPSQNGKNNKRKAKINLVMQPV